MGALDYLKDELATLADDGTAAAPADARGSRQALAPCTTVATVINLASNNYLGLANHPRMNRGGRDRRRPRWAPGPGRYARSPGR